MTWTGAWRMWACAKLSGMPCSAYHCGCFLIVNCLSLYFLTVNCWSLWVFFDCELLIVMVISWLWTAYSYGYFLIVNCLSLWLFLECELLIAIVISWMRTAYHYGYFLIVNCLSLWLFRDCEPLITVVISWMWTDPRMTAWRTLAAIDRQVARVYSPCRLLGFCSICS